MSLLGEISAFLSLWDRFRNWSHKQKGKKSDSIASRFIQLFEVHGVYRNQIPRYFGHNIELPDIHNEELLLLKLTDETLTAACTHFAVRREWLDGAETQAHPCHHFYKEPEQFADFIENLKRTNPDGQYRGVVVAPAKEHTRSEALFILQEMVGSIGDKAVYRYHLCDTWPLSYWKARTYLAACVAIAWKAKVFVHGTFTNEKKIKSISDGQTLLGWNGAGIWHFGSRQWDPEDMALRPEIFLRGLDPEQNNFGIHSGLSLWLELDKQGLMNTGLDKNPRPLFIEELAKY